MVGTDCSTGTKTSQDKYTHYTAVWRGCDGTRWRDPAGSTTAASVNNTAP